MLAPYALKLAIQSLLKEKWINLLSVLTIAAGLLIISISFLVLYNIDIATKKLPEKFSMTVYLDNSLAKRQTRLSHGFIQKEEGCSFRQVHI